jgi:hypothetical protein
MSPLVIDEEKEFVMVRPELIKLDFMQGCQTVSEIENKCWRCQSFKTIFFGIDNVAKQARMYIPG